MVVVAVYKPEAVTSLEQETGSEAVMCPDPEMINLLVAFVLNAM